VKSAHPAAGASRGASERPGSWAPRPGPPALLLVKPWRRNAAMLRTGESETPREAVAETEGDRLR
jgi:hypothetical protein